MNSVLAEIASHPRVGPSVGPLGCLQRRRRLRRRRPNCSGNEGDALLPHLVESSFIAQAPTVDGRGASGARALIPFPFDEIL